MHHPEMYRAGNGAPTGIGHLVVVIVTREHEIDHFNGMIKGEVDGVSHRWVFFTGPIAWYKSRVLFAVGTDLGANVQSPSGIGPKTYWPWALVDSMNSASS